MVFVSSAKLQKNGINTLHIAREQADCSSIVSAFEAKLKEALAL
jgi:hypothetical protein